MTGSFLDTTIVIDLSDRKRDSTKRFLDANPPTAVANYALRELLAGYLQVLCGLHNRLKAASSIGEVLVALVALHPSVGRKKQAALQAFAESFQANTAGDANRGVEAVGRDMINDLSLRIAMTWARSRKCAARVQPLSCFSPGKLTVGPLGEVVPPNGSFNCDKKARCAAAGYVYDKQSLLSKMIEALHPDALDQALSEKREIRQRRKALKELRDKGPEKFDKAKCRALGDAYFAAMCMPGYRVVTTNQSDFVPLCKAIGCELVEP